VATVATRLERENLAERKHEETHLTPTGLLMEGRYAQNPINERYGDFSPIEKH
jgi:hypothetical protein